MRHLRTVFDVDSVDTLLMLLQRAQVQKRARRDRRIAPTLAGRVVAMLFERESTRTRISFEAGVAMLGGSCVVLQSRDTQLVRGEPFRDSARVTGRYVDAVVVRAFEQATVEEYAQHAAVPVVNGLSGLDHPCQVLADLFTVYERREEPFALRWAWVGDTTPVANGLIAAAGLTKMNLCLGVPEGFKVDGGYLDRALSLGAKIDIVHSPEEAVAGAHVISTSAWSHGEDEAQRAALAPFRLTPELLSHAADDHFVLHSLPANRGEEIDDAVIEGRHSLVFQQAGNRLPVQQAVLEWLLEVPGAV